MEQKDIEMNVQTMTRAGRRVDGRGASGIFRAVLFWATLIPAAQSQHAYTWAELRDRFEAANPALQAAKLAVDESRAQEITAYLRPNPGLTMTLDQLNPFTGNPDHYRPLTYTLPALSFSYLHERQHKRELRRESAEQATAIAESDLMDQRRNLIFNLRAAYVQTLQAKAVLEMTRANLANWDQLLRISADRLKAGDIAPIDYSRLQLQRVQYETDLQTAEVNLRTAKIQLLQLLNDRMPVDRLDVNGNFDFDTGLAPAEEFRKLALDNRPDLKAAAQAVEKAATDHKLAVANSSTDPTFSVDIARNPPIPAYFGVSVNIPLRIFDRNQGERLRTGIEMRRAERLKESMLAQVFSDVDSSHTLVASSVSLLRNYKANYLQQALQVRDTVSFSYQRGGATLLDFLSAQNDYRGIQLNYLNLVGAYLTAAGQLNLAVGREAIQ